MTIEIDCDIIRYEGQKALDAVRRYRKVVDELRSTTQSSTLARLQVDSIACCWNEDILREMEPITYE